MTADESQTAVSAAGDPGPYRPADTYDEAVYPEGSTRPAYAGTMAALFEADLPDLSAACERAATDRDVVFGDDAFTLDPVPRIVEPAEWERIRAGLRQRARALNAFVEDVYGARRAVADGVIPARVVETANGYEPDLQRSGVPGAWPAGVAGFDIVRGADGEPRVLEDNLRTPSGMAYVLAARAIVAGTFPGDVPELRDPGDELPHLLAGALSLQRPAEDGTGGVSVLLSDGPGNVAHWEHRRLAEMLGIPVVQPADLRRDGDRVFVSLDDADHPVALIYRRTDCDRLRDAEGALTWVGELLLEPLLEGTVRCVNSFGTGVGDDKLVHAYVDDLVRYFLDDEPLIRSVPTHELGREEVRSDVLGRLPEVVLKPRGGLGGHGVLVGSEADSGELREAGERVRSDPEGWIAQDIVQLSTHPTVIGDRLEPRHVDLRPFVFSGPSGVDVLPGGLTRVAMRQGSLIVNSSQDGGGKDTWVPTAPSTSSEPGRRGLA
ncbi:MAG: circularly permuted type 2 ATP-grasp protein [Solirubrobacterales bacterium]